MARPKMVTFIKEEQKSEPNFTHKAYTMSQVDGEKSWILWEILVNLETQETEVKKVQSRFTDKSRVYMEMQKRQSDIYIKGK